MKLRIVVQSLTVLVVLGVLQFLGAQYFTRIDLTDNQRFTLAESSQQILQELESPLTLRVYFSKDMPPQYLTFVRGVHDLLGEYQRFGGKQFQIEYHDPRADADVERELLVFGIRPQLMNVVEADRQETTQVYLGMVMLRGDQHEVIRIDPREPTRHLEVGLTGSVLRLTREDTPTVAWWAPAAAENAAEGFEIARALLGHDVTIESLTNQAALNVAQHDAAVVIANATKQFSEDDLLVLDRYVQAGGNLLVLVRRIAVQPNFLGTVQTTGIESWLAQYGVEVAPRMVADAHNAYAVFQSGYVSYTVPYPLWPVPRRSDNGLNQSHAAVSQLDSLVMPWSSPITIQATPGLQAEVLLRSSMQSEVTPGEGPFSLEPEDVGMLLQSETQQQHVLAVSLRGRFGSQPQAGQLTVIGNTYFLQDQFIREEKFREGVSLVANLLDHSLEQDALIGVRSKPIKQRRFTREFNAQEKLELRYAGMLGVPVVLLFSGLMGRQLRRRRYRKLSARYRS